VETLEQELPRSADPLRSRLRSLRGHVAELSDDVRRTAYQLHPSTLEHLGLAAALKSYCADFSRTEGIQVHFEQRRLPESIPDDVALCLYRVTQESLGNVAKHSGARRASVALAGAHGSLHLEVSDAGKGFDPAAVKGRGGLGIVGMEERVRLLAGTFSIEARPKKGTAVGVHIPLPGRGSKT
jgi:signal transduction histidine kinase